MTYEEIMRRMLERIPDDMDKREGSVIFDALAPAAAELTQLYATLEWSMDQVFVDTASKQFLILKAKERGLNLREAKEAVVKAKATPLGVNVPVGARFNLEELNYTVVDKLSGDEYKLVCEAPGARANTLLGPMIPIDYVQDLEKFELIKIITPGEDEEDTDSFRSRLLNSYSAFAFGGNIADYKAKVNEIQGVGGVKVIPHWNGGGTVKLIIISSDNKPPTSDLVQQIQNEVDPVETAGQGYGIAPVGHKVTVEGAQVEKINISTMLVLESGYNYSDVKSQIEQALDDHYQTLAKEWDSKDNVIVRLATIQTLILGIDKVIDIENTQMNGQSKNIVIAPNKIPERGTFNVTSW